MPNGSATILNASAANGAFVVGLAVDDPRRRAGWCPCAGGMSSGLGRKSTTASSIGWTPLFLNAEPHSIGHEVERPACRCGWRVLRSASVSVLAGEVLLHQLVVLAGDRLEQLVAPLVGLVDHVGGDVDLVPLGALAPRRRQMSAFILTRSMRPTNGLKLGPPAPIGSWTTAGVGLEAVLDHLDGAVEVGADAVHLVDEAHARDVVLVGLAPHGLGLRLDAGDRVEHGDGAVEDAQRPLDLDREVDVARACR